MTSRPFAGTAVACSRPVTVTVDIGLGRALDVRTRRPRILAAGWLVLVGAALGLSGCRADTTPVPDTPARFHNVGEWTGHGNTQTGSFTSDTGGFRVQWEATHESRPGAGRLKVTFHSGDSGRPIMEAVDTTGVGRDVAYVSDRARWYYLVIESADVDWSVSVDEDLGEAPTRDKL